MKCFSCTHIQSNRGKDEQKCGNIVDCLTGYCLSTIYTTNEGLSYFRQGCSSDFGLNACPNAGGTCHNFIRRSNLQSCSAQCCTSDLCNDYANLTKSDSGTLKCWQCYYHSRLRKDRQKCGNFKVACPTGYCYSTTYTNSLGISAVERGCDSDTSNRFCLTDEKESCDKVSRLFNLKSCTGKCCTTDFCNDDTNIPNSDSGTLKCWQCSHHSGLPKDRQKCGDFKVDCPTGYCYSATYTTSEGITVVERGCDSDTNNRLCLTDEQQTCKRVSLQYNLKSCTGKCCSTNLCNSATEIMAGKFVFVFVIIMGYFFM